MGLHNLVLVSAVARITVPLMSLAGLEQYTDHRFPTCTTRSARVDDGTSFWHFPFAYSSSCYIPCLTCPRLCNERGWPYSQSAG
jgi:hypothetical protein